MSDISLRYEEREGIGRFLIGSVYSQSVSKDDTITVYKKDYLGVVLRNKTNAALEVTLDSVAGNLEVPESGVDTFIDVNETVASFAGAGETVVNLADALTKKWAVAFPYLRFKFSAAATIDFVVTLSQLDVVLQAKLERWGRAVEPEWVHAAEVTAPSAGTALVTKSVGTGKTGYIYGFFISAGEANDFKINWTTGGNAKSIRIPFSGKGSLQYVDFAALNEGMGADAGTSITITNVNAGGSGVVYQARILYAEV